MTIDKPSKTSPNTLTGEVIKVMSDDPNVKKAGKYAGESTLIISRTINNCLLPLAAVNYAFDKARIYFTEKFQDDISKKTSDIPPEQIIEPKASVAGPALQGLAFSHEEVNLKDMYLSLLATAMDIRAEEDAHPSFVEIIKQLNSEEATLIKEIFQSPTLIPIVEVRCVDIKKSSWYILEQYLVNDIDLETKSPIENLKIPVMISNCIRLGLIMVDFSKHLSNEEAYSWIEDRPEVKRFQHELNEQTDKIIFKKSAIDKTSFGISFAKTVGLI